MGGWRHKVENKCPVVAASVRFVCVKNNREKNVSRSGKDYPFTARDTGSEDKQAHARWADQECYLNRRRCGDWRRAPSVTRTPRAAPIRSHQSHTGSCWVSVQIRYEAAPTDCFIFKRKRPQKDESESYFWGSKSVGDGEEDFYRDSAVSGWVFLQEIAFASFPYRAATPVYAPSGILKLSRPKQPVHANE